MVFKCEFGHGVRDKLLMSVSELFIIAVLDFWFLKNIAKMLESLLNVLEYFFCFRSPVNTVISSCHHNVW